jgi:2-keto-4-pentenoate hydratase/2-oxohepta-3-ene-1,7-dioic acid hydratase in catechol pathway
MKIVRYLNSAGKTGYASAQADGSALAIRGDIFSEFEVTKEKVVVKKRLAPLVPSMIWCIGLNYKHHARETNSKIPEYPILFAKSPSALQNPGDPIEIPTHLRSDEVDYECELAVVIGKTCKNVTRGQALSYVLGYTCANDVSARDWQIKRGGSQWCRGKTFDTFAPLGPCLVTKEDIPDPHTLRIQTILNGETMQDWNTNDMIFDIPALIEFLSGSTTLLPGTVILTGTPQGVGLARKPPVWLKPGDSISIVIDQIGTLTNPVEQEAAQSIASESCSKVASAWYEPTSGRSR